MNWQDAMAAMMAGHAVRRRSGIRNEIVSYPEDMLDPLIINAGNEPIYLMAAWAHDNHPTRVFCGRWSSVPFIPSDEDQEANDWQIER